MALLAVHSRITLPLGAFGAAAAAAGKARLVFATGAGKDRLGAAASALRASLFALRLLFSAAFWAGVIAL
jgi:hypothetical protein